MSGRRAKVSSQQKVEERWIVIAVHGNARDKGGRTVPFIHIVVMKIWQKFYRSRAMRHLKVKEIGTKRQTILMFNFL